jgi:hypothetical protein
MGTDWGALAMTTNRYDANCILGRWADGGPTPRFLIGKVAYARLSAEEQLLILGENIARLMGWD